jgi:nucleoside-triphosphatase THEP1
MPRRKLVFLRGSGAGLKPNHFFDKIKKRLDTQVFYLTRENREKIKEEIKNLLKYET